MAKVGCCTIEALLLCRQMDYLLLLYQYRMWLGFLLRVSVFTFSLFVPYTNLLYSYVNMKNEINKLSNIIDFRTP